jgi:23S rRNA (cytidine1920-2'-O)/16S rRNA (cytidine1409-2'-O)-methyltransferase
MKQRLDVELVKRGLVHSRSQAESYIRLGQVMVNGREVTKAGTPVGDADKLVVTAAQQYVSRAALKLASVAEVLGLDFKGKTVLDVGSSTGGFTDYALRQGARKVFAVEVGTDQLHPSLRDEVQAGKIALFEQTDIRDFGPDRLDGQEIDIVVADVSFISLREILPSVARLVTSRTQIAVMVKPQFEAGQSSVKHKGVIKNDKMRRDILKDFEQWASGHFKIAGKADSEVSGARGNLERFYLLKKL